MKILKEHTGNTDNCVVLSAEPEDVVHESLRHALTHQALQ